MYILGKSRGHMIQLIFAMQANSLGAISHPFQYEADNWINYITCEIQLWNGKNYVMTTFVEINGKS